MSPTPPTRTSRTGSSAPPPTQTPFAAPAAPTQPDRLVSSPSITMPFSVGGLPALAIPCGFSRAEGLPLSLQIAARPFAEGLVLRIAHAYQEATDWHRRHPALS